MATFSMNNYFTRVFHDPEDVDADAWDSLLARQSLPSPFMRHAFLAALHCCGCATAETGWTLRWVTLWQDEALVAGAVTYLKAHSYGEYVFDWAWAHAYQQHGLHYYPKLLCAVPFTPVTGARLIACDEAAHAALARELRRIADDAGLSSAHVLFVTPRDGAALQADGWMLRETVQFHWAQDPLRPVASFDDHLARLHRHKRKNIVQERRKVREAGVHFTVHEGAEIGDAHWDYFYLCYRRTYAAHHASPYLTREFFHEVAHTMPQHWLMFVAHRGDEQVGASLIAIDRPQRLAWGRYWGCTATIDCLHFEACYYQPLAWCIEQGFVRFEGGAQGQHKMARGLMPVTTTSAHWLRDGRFAQAVADFLAREGAQVEAWVDELRERSPFRDALQPPDQGA